MLKIEETQMKMQHSLLLAMEGAPFCCNVCRFVVRAAPTREVQAKKSPLFKLQKEWHKPEVLMDGKQECQARK